MGRKKEIRREVHTQEMKVKETYQTREEDGRKTQVKNKARKMKTKTHKEKDNEIKLKGGDEGKDV